jgi:hypothetical protein
MCQEPTSIRLAAKARFEPKSAGRRVIANDRSCGSAKNVTKAKSTLPEVYGTRLFNGSVRNRDAPKSTVSARYSNEKHTPKLRTASMLALDYLREKSTGGHWYWKRIELVDRSLLDGESGT